MTPVIAFSVSLGAMMLFVSFKLIEQSWTLAAYRSFRTSADKLVVKCAKHVMKRMTKIEQHLSMTNVVYVTIEHAATAVARTAQRIEHHAHEVTRRMARSAHGKMRETQSPFLQEVSTHKNGLDTERVKRETSLTENQ